MRRLLALFGSLALATLATGAIGSTPAVAAPIKDCTASAGTIVAVDFGHWRGPDGRRGPVARGCDTGSPSDGAALLSDAGFTTTNVQGEAFLCRIGNGVFDSGKQYPTGDRCTRTPPATAYWSYWTAAAGQNRWTYSKLGAYEQHVSPGEVELWTFGSTSTPTITPNSLRPSTPAPRPTTPAPRRTSPAPDQAQTQSSRHRAQPSTARDGARRSSNPAQAPNTSSAVPASTGRQSSHASATSSSGSTTSSSTKAGSGSAVSGASGVPVAVGSPPAERIIDAQPASRTSSAGSAVPLIVGIAIVAVLAAAGGFTVWRRRGRAD